MSYVKGGVFNSYIYIILISISFGFHLEGVLELILLFSKKDCYLFRVAAFHLTILNCFYASSLFCLKYDILNPMARTSATTANPKTPLCSPLIRDSAAGYN